MPDPTKKPAPASPAATPAPADRDAKREQIRTTLTQRGLDAATVAALTEDLANIVWGT